MRILVIGANSFIGKHLIKVAAKQNIEIIALSRSGLDIDGAKYVFKWAFGQGIPEAASRDLTCSIFLAHDFDGEEGADITVNSTVSIATKLKSEGLNKQVFFSSYSAGENASSIYGKAKFSLEQSLSAVPGMIIVRPGLVMGNGGIYKRIDKWARLLPIIPLPGGGWGEVPVIRIEKLCKLTLDIVLGTTMPKEANLFEDEKVSLRQLVLNSAAEAGRRPWIFPIPIFLLRLVLSLSSMLRIPLPVNVDNLDGFLKNQSAIHMSTI